ncbi:MULTISPECIES: DUF1707 SHOCT-like domain-containing protein [Streptomyces]|uniref:DUF1707 SHOCT-like domain-containing protein n=1 Tax=Streptomyces TaxID=1883 RepID=UPI000689D5D6|nr:MULTISPECIES: DUF1707 domain-containing protein [Streptomyces]
MSIEEPGGRVERDPSLLRVSHADRDRMVEILRDAAADGRLDADELEERVERALTARTFADLAPLTEDLPVAPPAPPRVLPPAVPVVPIASVVPDGEVERWQVSGQRFRREGAWVVPRAIELGMYGGSARLDYTVARLPEGGLSALRIAMYGGSVRLTLPLGVAVDLSGLATHGGRVRDHASRHTVPGVAVTHVVTVSGFTHGGSLRVVASRA